MSCYNCYNSDNIYTVNTTTLCRQCKERYYIERFNLSSYRYMRDPQHSVWMGKIGELFRGITYAVQIDTFAAIAPGCFNLNVNDNPEALIRYIVEKLSRAQLRGLTSKITDPSVIAEINRLRKNVAFYDSCLKAAQETSEYTRKIILHIGNYELNLLDERGIRMYARPEVYDMRGEVNTHFEQNGITDRLEKMRVNAEYIMKRKVGNCGEHSIIAFLHLLDHYPFARPIDWFTRIKDHEFVTIGAGDPRNFFLPGTIICDPYFGHVYEYEGSLQKKQKSETNQYMSNIKVDESNNVIYHNNAYYPENGI